MTWRVRCAAVQHEAAPLPPSTPSSAECSRLGAALSQHADLWTVIRGLNALQLPNPYVGAGAVAQTTWNVSCGLDAAHAIRDIDVVYFDANDLSEQAEERVKARVRTHFADVRCELDVKNQARVHVWYERKFQRRIDPFTTVEEAIATWPTSATAVGVRWENDTLKVHAPYGLADLLNLVVRPNPALVTKALYEGKAARWKAAWPALRVMPWSTDDQGGP